MTPTRTPHALRDYWMEQRHKFYPSYHHLHDIDQAETDDVSEEKDKMWMEHQGKIVYGLADFKQENEICELHKLGHQTYLADGRNIPSYVVFGCKHPYPYFFVYPLNQACLDIYDYMKPEGVYMSEARYLHFLALLRGKKMDQTAYNHTNIRLGNAGQPTVSSKLPSIANRFVPKIVP